MPGPLAGLRIVELAGLGAAPYCGMMLADLGAELIRCERLPLLPLRSALPDPLARGRRSVALDLKDPRGRDLVLELVGTADGLIEGYRPGVTERLGLGPEDCHARNPRLVYGRMTGWGQEGPLAATAGHDLNYVGLSGALAAIGPTGGKPVPPLNLVGDFGGGLLLAFGMAAAFLERERSGEGQVVDAAMLDAAASFMAMFSGLAAMGLHPEGAGRSFLGGAAHFYDTYETADGRYLAVAALEPEFYAILVDKTGLDPERYAGKGFRLDGAMDPADWPALKAELAEVFRTRTRDEWCALFEGTDGCVTPVLELSEAPRHPHNAARGTFTEIGGVEQAAPAPRYSRTRPETPAAPVRQGADTRAVLAELGLGEGEIDRLVEDGVAVAR